MKKAASLCVLLAALVFFAGGMFYVLVPRTFEGAGKLSALEVEKLPDKGGKDNSEKEKMGKTEEDTKEQIPKKAEIQDFEVTLQTPELPTGCEITALTMMLDYYGFDVDKTVMASKYLPVCPAEISFGTDGRTYGPDMESSFVGDPFTREGYICGTKAICTAANRFFEDAGSSMRGKICSGAQPEELYGLVAHKIPVLVWVTIGMQDRSRTQGWYTKDGRYMQWSSNDHGAVLIGYDQRSVRIADPISGVCEYDREQFEAVFRSRGNQCVILEEKK